METLREKFDGCAQDVLLAWQTAHGSSTGSAKALSGPGHLAILLEKIFSPAELKMTMDQTGELLLRQYLTELVGELSSQMVEHVQHVLGRTVRAHSVNINPNENQILLIFALS